MDESMDQEALPELVEATQIAALLGVSKQRVRELVARSDHFPPPAARLGERLRGKGGPEGYGDLLRVWLCLPVA